MKTKMTLKEALTKRNTMRDRLAGLYTKIPLIGINVTGTNPPDEYKTVDEFKKMSQSYWDSLASLRKNLTVLTTAIQFANSTNMVNIKGFGEISIAAALELHENEFPYDKRNRRRTSKLNVFHSAIVSESARKLDERNKKIIAIEKDAVRIATEMTKEVTDPTIKKQEFEKFKQSYIDKNKVEMITWDGIEKHITWYEWAANSDNLSKIIEVAVQNATATITIEVDLSGDDVVNTNIPDSL